MTDISMQYLGMKLSGPIVVSSTPLSESIDNVRKLEDAGASAIVLGSLSILTKRPEMWYLSMGSAGVGIVLAVSTYWVS